jgi:RHS repeat-associated protein
VRDSWSLANGRWKYIGKEFDGETATLDLEAREYDPLVGHFWQVDPLMHTPELAGYSPYHYSFNNPYKFKDPDGKNPILGVILGVAFEVASQVIEAKIKNEDYNPFKAENLAKAAVAGVAGGLSGGLSVLAQGQKLGKVANAAKVLAEVGIDATESVAKQKIDKPSEDINILDVSKDVVAGATGRAFGNKIGGTMAQESTEISIKSGQKESLRINLETGVKGVEKTQGQINKQATEAAEKLKGKGEVYGKAVGTGISSAIKKVERKTDEDFGNRKK